MAFDGGRTKKKWKGFTLKQRGGIRKQSKKKIVPTGGKKGTEQAGHGHMKTEVPDRPPSDKDGSWTADKGLLKVRGGGIRGRKEHSTQRKGRKEETQQSRKELRRFWWHAWEVLHRMERLKTPTSSCNGQTERYIFSPAALLRNEKLGQSAVS